MTPLKHDGLGRPTTKLSEVAGRKDKMHPNEFKRRAEQFASVEPEAKPLSLKRIVSRPREITPDDVTKEADRNYELGRKHGHAEKADLLDWAESLLCNAVPMSHCTQEDWDAAVKKWRDEKHGVAKSANKKLTDAGPDAPGLA